MTITVLSKPACVQCFASYRALDSKNADYNIVDMSQDEAALARAKEMGYLAAPVLIVEDADGNIVDHWGGFNPEKIAEYANAQQLATV